MTKHKFPIDFGLNYYYIDIFYHKADLWAFSDAH